MNIVQNNIRTIRKKLGYTQKTVASVLGIARTTYTEYETKEMEIPFDILEKLSDFFGVDLASFFAENEKQLNDTLVCAFRTDGLSIGDLRKIARFKSIVKNYIKMKRIIG
jgi:transcriptional regulator with XRE-family HTH domain